MQTIKIQEDQKKETLVEVFKTNVNDELLAVKVIAALERLFPDYKINFDLDDCDKILRVEPKCVGVEVKEVMNVVRSLSCNIEIL